MKTSSSLLASSLFLLGAIGCGPASTDLQACRSRAPSITQTGVFGCVTSTSDVGDMTTTVMPDFNVQAFTSEPSSNPDDGAIPQASTMSDAEGFYELALVDRHYWICTSFRRCKEQNLDATPRRLDYSFSLGPGWQ